jgi:uncharacterized protein (DUF305 family)
MAEHHAVGVQLATLAASNAGDPDLRQLGRLRVANQAGEIQIIAGWWRNWMHGPLPPMSAAERAHIPGLPEPRVIAQLSAERGDRFDAAFVPVMIVHHRGAVHMADEAWRTATDPRVRLLADSIRHAQTGQISAMATMLATPGRKAPL